MKINKNIFICALLVLMLLCCVNAVSAEESLNETLTTDTVDEVVVADAPVEELSASGDTYVVDANGGGDYETISSAVSAATGGETIFVKNGDYSEANTITFTKSVSIIGESQDGVKITGPSKSLFSTVEPAITLSFTNLTILNAGGGSNPALKLTYSAHDLTVTNCTFDGCGSKWGTMQFGHPGTAVIDNCKILNSKEMVTAGCGAIYASGAGQYTIKNTIIDNVQYIPTSSYMQGVIYVSNNAAVLNIENTTISNATAPTRGIINTAGTVNIKGSKIQDNTLSQFSDAMTNHLIYIGDKGTVNIEQTEISDNTCVDKLFDNYKDTSKITVNYCNIHDNAASGTINNLGTIDLEANWWGSNDKPADVAADTWVVENNGEYTLNNGDALEKEIPGLTDEGGDEPGPEINYIYVSPDGDGDGSSIDSPTDLETALQIVPEGGSIFFCNGDYSLEDAMFIPKSVSFVGESRDGVELIVSQGFAIANPENPFDEEYTVDSVSFSKMTIDGSAADTVVYASANVNELNITDCVISAVNNHIVSAGVNVMSEPMQTTGTLNFKRNILQATTSGTLWITGNWNANINNNLFLIPNEDVVMVESTGDVNVDYNYWGSSNPTSSVEPDVWIEFTANANPSEIYNDESSDITVAAVLNDGSDASSYLPDYSIPVTLSAKGTLSQNEFDLNEGPAQATYTSDVARSEDIKAYVLTETLTIPITVKERYAGIIYVDVSGSDDNEGSINAPVATIAKAIELANAGSHEIIINEGTYVGNGYHVTDDLTVTGNGKVTLDANNEGRLFYMNYGDTANKIELHNLVLTNANGFGAAVYSLANELILDNVTVVNNQASNYLITSKGKLTIKDSEISNSMSGDVIQQTGNGDILINNTVFKDNSIVDSTSVMAVINLNSYNGNLVIENSKFINNTARQGVIKGNYNYNIDVKGTEFIDNTNTVSYGGAIYTSGGTLDISDCVFINNKAARSGGAIYVGYRTTAVVDKCIFVNNTANTMNDEYYGDAIYDGNKLTVNNSVLLTNSNNGLIYSDGEDNVPYAQNCWWGTNDDPSSLNGVGYYEDDDWEEYDCPPVDVSNWVTMDASFTPADAQAGDEVTVTAVFSNANLPDGINVTFTSTSGNLNTVVSTVDAQASTTYTIDANDEAINATSTNAVVEMPLTESFTTNIVTNDTFYNFFDESGFLRDEVPYDELIFQGEFSDLAAGYVIIGKSITITGDNAVLNNMGFVIASEDVALDGLTFVANTSLGDLISVTESYVSLLNLTISYVVDEVGSANAINIKGTDTITDVYVLDSVIYFESHTTKDNDVVTAINLDDVEDVYVDGCNIVANMPSLTVESYDYTYFMMGLSYVNPVRLREASASELTNNHIEVIVNSYDSSFPTVQALYIVGSDDILVKGNNFTMTDDLTPAGTAIYLYAIECGFSEGIEFIENNFNISTTGGKSGSGSAYALQVATSEATFIGNNITCDSNGPNLGIYSPYGFGPAKDLVIKDNFLNISGYATGNNDFALISGIEIQTGYATIYNNTIYVQNKGDYEDDCPVTAISAVQYSAKTLTFDIKDNEVYTNGKYAVEMLYPPQSAVVVNNTLYAYELTGDAAVYIKSGDNNEVHDNLPAEELTNIVTNDTFFKFFDENGMLLDTIEFDELIFQGEFSDLVETIIISDEITLTSDNAVLNNIALYITGDDVTVTGFTLNENDADFTNNGGAALYVSGSDVTLDNVSVTYNAPSEVEAKAIFANGAENFALINSEIIFTGANPGENHYRGLEVRNSNNAKIDNNTISAVLPAVAVDWTGSGIGQDLVLAVGIQGGNDVEFTNNRINVNTNGAVGSYPTIDAVMIHSANDLLVKGNNITHMDTTTEDSARYYYSLDIYSTTGTVEANNIIVNTTAGVDRAGTAYPIQLTGPYTITVKDNNLTAVSKGPIAGIYTSNWPGAATLTVENNNIDVTGYATTGNYALVAGIEAEIDVFKAYNNTITVANGAEYDDANQVIGVGIGSSYFYGDTSADIKDNNITVDGKYAVYYAKAINTNVTGNTLYGHELEGDDAAIIEDGENNIIKDNLPVKSLANIDVLDSSAWIGTDATVTVTVPNATGTVTIEVNGKSYDVELVDGVATKDIPAEDLVAGENIVTATYNGPDFDSNNATGVLYVLDGVVTQDTYEYYFNQEDSGKFFDYVPEGATLDFQGSIINPDQSINIWFNVNKPVNIVSTTNDAYIDLNTTAGSLMGENPGNRFTVSYGGSGSNITGLNFHNTQLWVANTHNVVLDNISNVIEDQRVGSGVGATSVRENCTYVTVKNSYFYTRNNGGSSSLVMAWADYCTFDNNTIVVEGNVGNMIYLTTFNVNVPSGVVANVHNKITNNHIYSPNSASAICWALVLSGSDNLIENNTIEYKGVGITTQFGSAASPNNTYRNNKMLNGSSMNVLPDSVLYNNTITGALTVGARSVAYNNTVGGKMSVAQGAHAYNNTVAGGVATTGTDSIIENNTITGAVTINKVGTTFIGNDVNGTVTVSANNNVIKGNNITTTGNYAVDLGSKTGNNVTDNYLVAALYKGDAAVKFSNANNIVENNLPVAPVVVAADSTWIGNNANVTVTVANTTGTVTITVNGKDQTVELVDGVATVEVAGEDLAAGTNVLTVTYNGPEYAPLTVEDVIVVLDGVVTQDTYMYYFNQEDAGRFFDYVPEGATLDFQGSIINPDQNAKIWFNVNKPVNIITTTNDAYIDLNTTAGSLTGDNPGNRFTIGYGGSGSNMTGINFHNTQLWIANTHNVVLDNISNVVEDQRVGSGVGATSVRENCTYVTVKNSYFYTRNNGGSSSLVMAWADYCTFDNNTIVVEGNVGNMIYLTTFNVNVPSGVVANVHNNITNNHIYSPNSASAICWALVLSGSDNLIENNTIEYKGVGITTQFGSAASPNNTYRNNKMLNGSSMSVLPDSVLYNNTITGALTVGARSVAYNNTVGGKMSVAQGAYAYDNIVAGGVATTGTDAIIENNTITGAVTINKVGTTFIGNDVAGTVTVSANNNVIKGNNITTTGNYAVDLGSKTGNNVTDNYLVSALYKGDAAVKFSNANNIVENNYPVSTVLTAEDLDMNYKDGSAWVVTLTDGTNPIAGAVVKVGILGKTYSLKTGADGTVTLPINVAPGNYDVGAAYDGDGLHESAFVNATVTVGKAVSTLTAENITMSYKNGSWIVTLTGAEGVIPKAAIKFGILGKVYTVETDENGVAALAINLAPGTYQINATFGGNAKHESAFVDATVTVEKAVATIASEDLTMSYKDGSAYAVTVTDAKGAVLAGTTVKFTFGTKSYNIKTDANGVAALPINLNIGEYTVNAVVDDAKYTSEEVTNTVTVTDYDAVLVANDINMTYQDGTNYEVQLTTADGTPITVANLVVKITLLGKTYSIKTDAEGIAKLPINLRAGTYVFTAEYNGSQVNSTVVVNKA